MKHKCRVCKYESEEINDFDEVSKLCRNCEDALWDVRRDVCV